MSKHLEEYIETVSCLSQELVENSNDHLDKDKDQFNEEGISSGKSKSRKRYAKGSAAVLRSIGILNYLHQTPNFFGIDLIHSIRINCPFVYRINDGVSNNIILQAVCQERGWQEYKDPFNLSNRERDIHNDAGWNLWWSYNFFHGTCHRPLKCWQFTNHNPRAFQFCNKSYLTSFLRKMKEDYGNSFNFGPKSFVLPSEYIRFITEHTRRQQDHCPDAYNVIVTHPNSDAAGWDTTYQTKKLQSPRVRDAFIRTPIWITKPIGKSQGKGIYLSSDITQISTDNRGVVQEYISRPLLIGGYKWDIRIYVCITSTDPLVIYIYREGLCRFATEKFDLSKLTASYSHLTNASLNKMAPEYPTKKEIIGSGCKWSLKQLRRHLKEIGISDWLLWQKIMSMVVLTVVGEGLSTGYTWPSNRNCFDFFGFDILVDETLRPWLLEVNYSPGLGGDCAVDDLVKKPMLHKLFDLLGYPDCSNGSNSNYCPAGLNKKINDSLRSKTSLFPQKIVDKLTNKLKPFDFSCEARLKETQAIYSQDMVVNYLEKYAKESPSKLTRAMKSLIKKKRAQEELKRNQESLHELTNKGQRLTGSGSGEMAEEYFSNSIQPSSNIDDSTNLQTMDPSTNSNPLESNCPSNSKPEEVEDGSYLYLKRQDWNFPPQTCGDWVLVHPSENLPHRLPYRSHLSELRFIVATMEQYLKVANLLVNTYPGESDEFYKDKMIGMTKRGKDIWIPPVPQELMDL